MDWSSEDCVLCLRGRWHFVILLVFACAAASLRFPVALPHFVRGKHHQSETSSQLGEPEDWRWTLVRVQTKAKDGLLETVATSSFVGPCLDWAEAPRRAFPRSLLSFHFGDCSVPILVGEHFHFASITYPSSWISNTYYGNWDIREGDKVSFFLQCPPVPCKSDRKPKNDNEKWTPGKNIFWYILDIYNSTRYL